MSYVPTTKTALQNLCFLHLLRVQCSPSLLFIIIYDLLILRRRSFVASSVMSSKETIRSSKLFGFLRPKHYIQCIWSECCFRCSFRLPLYLLFFSATGHADNMCCRVAGLFLQGMQIGSSINPKVCKLNGLVRCRTLISTRNSMSLPPYSKYRSKSTFEFLLES